MLLLPRTQAAWSVLDRPMPYGMNDVQATIQGEMVYVTGGEPNHWYNFNTEDVVMIGKIRAAEREARSDGRMRASLFSERLELAGRFD